MEASTRSIQKDCSSVGPPRPAAIWGSRDCQVQQGPGVGVVPEPQVGAHARGVGALIFEHRLADLGELVLLAVQVAPAAGPDESRLLFPKLQCRCGEFLPWAVHPQAADKDLCGGFSPLRELRQGPAYAAGAGDFQLGVRMLQQGHGRRAGAVQAVVGEHRHSLPYGHAHSSGALVSSRPTLLA